MLKGTMGLTHKNPLLKDVFFAISKSISIQRRRDETNIDDSLSNFDVEYTKIYGWLADEMDVT